MTYQSALIFGLILLSNIDIAQSDTGICYQCKDILNQVQCNNSIFYCNWNSNQVCVIKSGYASPTAAQPVSASAQAPSSAPTCASKTTQSKCYGVDGSTYTSRCVFDNNMCHGVNAYQACSQYTTRNQCNINSACFYTPTQGSSQSSTSGTCANHKCGDITNNMACNIVVTSAYSAIPCKWVFYNNATSTNSTQLSTQGTCVNGLASDISKAQCTSQIDFYFTYSDANNVCTACTDTISSGANLKNLSFLFAAAMLVSLNW